MSGVTDVKISGRGHISSPGQWTLSPEGFERARKVLRAWRLGAGTILAGM